MIVLEGLYFLLPLVESDTYERATTTNIEPNHTDANAIENSPMRPRSLAREYVYTHILTSCHHTSVHAELLVSWDRSRL